MEDTSRDFWKMVYERDSSSIVMLSGIIECDMVSSIVVVMYWYVINMAFGNNIGK